MDIVAMQLGADGGEDGMTCRRRRMLAVIGLMGLWGCTTSESGGPLVVFNAAALGPPFRALGDSLSGPPLRLEFLQENAPSVEAIRKLTDLGRVPDVLATADVALFDAMILPTHSSWYVIFGSNALVLAYGPQSIGRDDLSADTWWEVLLRPNVRTGRSDPSVDPSGYRTLMALQLAERHYGEPGLAARLLAAMPDRYVRHAEAELSALIQAGEMDYIWTYRNLALAHRLEYVDLPPEINLSDPLRREWYGQATAEIAGRKPGDTLQVIGAPILFALTVPDSAPHPEAARVFLKLLLSTVGAAVLRSTGFEPLHPPQLIGQPPRYWSGLLDSLATMRPVPQSVPQ